MDGATIRHYQNSDRAAVVGISGDTAFFGKPVEAFLEDRLLYCDAFTRYYLDFETPFVLVADCPDGLAGFLLGCADTTSYLKRWREYLVTRVLVRTIFGHYKLGPRTARFAWGMLAGLTRRDKPEVNLQVYPAHMQIDVRQGYRGVGVGYQLINAYLDQLRALGICGVHLGTISHNEVACHLYESMGFQKLGSHPNYYWTGMLGEKVNNRSYGLKLG
jgi:ribosomal protein S18 acetylase RimI-like enzyme